MRGSHDGKTWLVAAVLQLVQEGKLSLEDTVDRWLPGLLRAHAPPATTYHHSNISWNIAGLIAAKAAGKPLPTLYPNRIFQPLRLRHTAYDPQGPIAGAHANGYAFSAN